MRPWPQCTNDRPGGRKPACIHIGFLILEHLNVSVVAEELRNVLTSLRRARMRVHRTFGSACPADEPETWKLDGRRLYTAEGTEKENAHTHTHARIHSYVIICIYIYTYIRTYVRTYKMCVCIYTYIHL